MPEMNPVYGGGDSQVFLQVRRNSRYAYQILESDDGKYYVTDTGRTLHLDKRCGMLWCSSKEITDETRTLAYRIMTRGREVGIWSADYTTRIDQVCEFCGGQYVPMMAEKKVIASV